MVCSSLVINIICVLCCSLEDRQNNDASPSAANGATADVCYKSYISINKFYSKHKRNLPPLRPIDINVEGALLDTSPAAPVGEKSDEASDLQLVDNSVEDTLLDTSPAAPVGEKSDEASDLQLADNSVEGTLRDPPVSPKESDVSLLDLDFSIGNISGISDMIDLMTGNHYDDPASDNFPMVADNSSLVSTVDTADEVVANNPIPSTAADRSTGTLERGRKRQRDPENWKRNVRRKRRNEGLEYTSCRGKVVEARRVKEIDCVKCRFNCSKNFCNEARHQIFAVFWGLGDHDRRTDFIAHHCEKSQKKQTCNEPSRRNFSISYYLTNDNQRIRVCKEFFLKTLDIGQDTVYVALNKNTQFGAASSSLRRQRTPSNKFSDETQQRVTDHIGSFPTMESHYARSQTNKKFLDSGLNVRKMYELYEQQCLDENIKPVSETYYRHIFHTEFNLSFHVPKKDYCDFCHQFFNLSQPEKVQKQDMYDRHQERKERVRQIKEEQKQLSKTDVRVHAITFDLQQVLTSPKMNVGALYYKRKYNTYNFTVYSLKDSECDCYMWHEATAKRGSCEIATCLQSYIQKLPPHVERLVCFSDTCAGQNRNVNLSAMFLHLAVTKNITIDHIYMEKGHSQMECDSVHSTIERSFKHQNVYAPSDYYVFVRSARRQGTPYRVNVLETADIKNFKATAKSLVRNRSKDDAGNTVRWLSIKWFRYEPSESGSILFKYEYDDEFRRMPVTTVGRRRKHSDLPPQIVLKPLYKGQQSISKAKFDDLLSLCSSMAIPREYHSFYQSLPHDDKATDALPEPDATEDDDIENA